jgi:putative phosphoesterase
MRVAVLSDIHGNLPALQAVLGELPEVDAVVVGGDVAAGPLPAETLDALAELDARCVQGNADRLMVAAFDAGADPAELDDPIARLDAWCAQRITRAHRDALAAYEPTVSLDGILFCHGSPRSDEEIITAISPEARLAPMFEGVSEGVVVCGHTHHQFDRDVLGKRLVNAGSVGMPYEDAAAAYWLLLVDGEPSLRRTDYDIDAAVARLRASGFPDIDELMLRESLLEPVGSTFVAQHFEERAARVV